MTSAEGASLQNNNLPMGSHLVTNQSSNKREKNNNVLTNVDFFGGTANTMSLQ